MANHDKRISLKDVFASGDTVSIVRPPLPTYRIGRIAPKAYIMFPLRLLKLCLISSVVLNYVMILQKGIENVISIDRTAWAPCADKKTK